MSKLLLTGVGGNLGNEAARVLLRLTDRENIILCGYEETLLKTFAEQGVETRITNFNKKEGLKEAFRDAERLALISMPFVGKKRQNAHKNVVDACTDDFVKLTGERRLTVPYMFAHASEFQVGKRHSLDE